jgi:hypothetical protein
MWTLAALFTGGLRSHAVYDHATGQYIRTFQPATGVHVRPHSYALPPSAYQLAQQESLRLALTGSAAPTPRIDMASAYASSYALAQAEASRPAQYYPPPAAAAAATVTAAAASTLSAQKGALRASHVHGPVSRQPAVILRDGNCKLAAATADHSQIGKASALRSHAANREDKQTLNMIVHSPDVNPHKYGHNRFADPYTEYDPKAQAAIDDIKTRLKSSYKGK